MLQTDERFSKSEATVGAQPVRVTPKLHHI